MIFQELFNNNENKWSEKENDSVFMAVQDSGYLFEHKKSEQNWTSGTHIEIPAGTPYRIYTTLEKHSGVVNNGYGLIWRGNVSNDVNDVDETAESYGINDFWAFEVSADGHYRICQWDGSTWHNHVPWTRSDYVLTGNDFNDFVIVQDLDSATFYLNGMELETVATPPVDDAITKQIVGFIINNQMRIKARHITIDEHDETVPLASYRSGVANKD